MTVIKEFNSILILSTAKENIMENLQEILSSIDMSQHTMDHITIACMDGRFFGPVVHYLLDRGLIGHTDVFFAAGSQQNFLSDEFKAFALKQIELSRKLHDMKTVTLVAHWDCGAYGGNKALGGGDEERAKYADDLEAAKQVIAAKFPDLEFELVLAKPEGNKVDFQKIA